MSASIPVGTTSLKNLSNNTVFRNCLSIIDRAGTVCGEFSCAASEDSRQTRLCAMTQPASCLVPSRPHAGKCSTGSAIRYNRQVSPQSRNRVKTMLGICLRSHNTAAALGGTTFLQWSGQHPFCDKCMKLLVIAEDRPAALSEQGPSFAVALTKVLQRPTQDGERGEIWFVENFVHRIEDFPFTPGPLKFMYSPFDTFPVKSADA